MTVMFSHSFAYSARADARVLILGSMPGKKSLAENQYYAHPRNLFWPLMQELLGVDRAMPYPQRLRALHAHGIALWDVLQCCERPGSLDGHIVRASEIANDLTGFRRSHPRLQRICLNGGKAAELFARHIRAAQPSACDHLQIIALPSTSPANAGQSREWKREQWRAALAGITVAHDNGGAKSVEI